MLTSPSSPPLSAPSRPLDGRSDAKRANGRYFTRRNLFAAPGFRAWAKAAGLPQATLIEPFAGGGDLLAMLTELNLCEQFHAYDIAPAAASVMQRDSLADFPNGDVVVTNPPWLARNSATRRRLPFPATTHDDLYKHCLQICLDHAAYVAAIVPASFLSAGIFRLRLTAVDLANAPVFQDTENPACLAMFAPDESADVVVYEGGKRVGALSELERHLPRPTREVPMRFNDPHGALGFVAFDNTRAASIRFCRGEELRAYRIGATSRMITRIGGRFGRGMDALIDELNLRVREFRRATSDVFLTPFKGLRKDAPRLRRRMEFRLARAFVAATLS